MQNQPDNLIGIPPRISQAHDRRMRELQAELMTRQIEALNLYEPHAKQADFHACPAMDRILTGGNRSGKSVCGYVEDARACLGRDPQNKYPKEGVLIILGYGWEHCGKVVYRLLFQKGAFQIIKDKDTGKWRAFHPDDPGDAVRRDEARPAPPLIPERYLKGGRKGAFAWNDRKKRQFTSVELTTGWTIYYFASEGDPEQAQGFPADLGHIDENIHDRRWVGELFARLADRRGRFVWSTIPGEDRTGALNELIDDADKQIGKPDQRIARFEMPFFDNPYIGKEEKQLQMARWSVLGEDELRRRAYGQAGQSYLMYPSFCRAVHGMNRSELPGGVVPSHWTRYVVVDPGHTVTAVLFAAVPPPQEKLMALLYDELYLSQCTAPLFGDQMAQRCGGQNFEAFIIDDHGGNLADLTTGSTWRQTLARQLKRHNIRCRRTGSEFLPGSDDIEARGNAVRLALYAGDGPPRLKYLIDAVPSFERTMQRYHKKRDKLTKHITDRPDDRGDVHLAQCCEYLFAFDPQYHRAPAKQREANPAVKAFRAERARERRSQAPVSFV